ncbi:MAG: DEAD/DEAH box helicase [Gemmatimonadota bacterium]
MSVLHGLWHTAHGLCLWAELQRTTNGGAGAAGAALDTASHDAIRAALDSAGVDPFRCPARHGALELFVPATGPNPARSPFVLPPAGAELPPDTNGIVGVAVPVLGFRGSAAAEVLLNLGRSSSDPMGPAPVEPADDLRFLCEAAMAAIERVARGRVLPAFEQTGDMVEARWVPVPGDEVADRLESLGHLLPPAGRAAEPEVAPAELVARTFAALVDATARLALATAPEVEAGEGGGWIEPLLAPESTAQRSTDALGRTARAVTAWTRPLRAAEGRTFRTCFRLVAPAAPADTGAAQEPDDAPSSLRAHAAPGGPERDAWRVEFLLQGLEDRSLLVPAEHVWRGGAHPFRARGGGIAAPREALLADLARGRRLHPPLNAALRTGAPTALELDATGAHHFLREGAPALERAGFGVLVPPWWKDRRARLGVQVEVSSDATSSGLLGLEGLLAYQWRLAVGDQVLDADEFRRLAAHKVGLVRVRGTWVELAAEDVAAALRLLEMGQGPDLSLLDALRMQEGQEASPFGLPVVGVDGEGPLAELLRGTAEMRVEPVPAPAGFHGELRPYQSRGLSWLAFLDRLGLGACLADDMGLGKTIQLLALLVHEREAAGPAVPPRPRKAGRKRGRKPAPVPPTLLICPMSVVGNWQHEAARFAPGLRVHVHHGGDRATGKAFARAAARADLVLTTYALAARDHEALAAVAWRRVVLDEAQNIKNAATRQARAIRALPSERRVALTGTPVENRLSELWSIMDFLNPGLLGAERGFRRDYALPIERYRDGERADALRRLTAPFILRRLKTDGGIIRDLPDKQEMKVYCNLTPEQATLYQAVVDEMMLRIEESEGMERRGAVLAGMLRLKQVCNHPSHMLADRSPLPARSGKLARLEEILEEVLASGERALVFTQFAAWGERLQAHLRERFRREVFFLSGRTGRGERERLVAHFQGPEGPPILLLSLKAGGVGLNLTAANHVIHFDRWWNPAVEDQATDRAFRIGQRRNVQVRKFVCAGTLEERIDAMIESKKELAERIVGSGDGWVTELSTAELRELVALGPDAEAE